MSVAIPIVLRILGLFGVKLSPFIAGAILAGALAIGAGALALHLFNAGWHSADNAWQAKALQSRIDALTADRDLARRALADERLRVASIEKQASDDKQGTLKYVEDLKLKFSTACAIDDDDLRGMRAGPPRADAARPRAAAGAGFLAPFRRRPADREGR